MLQRGKRSQEFFTDGGSYHFSRQRHFKRLISLQGMEADIEIPTGVSLELSKDFLEGRNKEIFMDFIRGMMLQWRPEDRKTVKDLLQDPWLNGQIE